MKIEKVNENQIRCTLTREDLASRELKISELAYGTEKAKNLFRDMMQQANFEFGFEAEDIPLMIEAIPLNSECIVLIVTKVEDPEELDTRFARFAPSVTEDDEEDDESRNASNEVLDLFRRLKDSDKPAAAASAAPSEEKPANEGNRTLIFQMDSLQQVMNAAAITGNHYEGLSMLYKDERSGKYLLVLIQNGIENTAFNKICNTISEYGSPQHALPASLTFLAEHYETLIPEQALQLLGRGNAE